MNITATLPEGTWRIAGRLDETGSCYRELRVDFDDCDGEQFFMLERIVIWLDEVGWVPSVAPLGSLGLLTDLLPPAALGMRQMPWLELWRRSDLEAWRHQHLLSA